MKEVQRISFQYSYDAHCNGDNENDNIFLSYLQTIAANGLYTQKAYRLSVESAASTLKMRELKRHNITTFIQIVARPDIWPSKIEGNLRF